MFDPLWISLGLFVGTVCWRLALSQHLKCTFAPPLRGTASPKTTIDTDDKSSDECVREII